MRGNANGTTVADKTAPKSLSSQLAREIAEHLALSDTSSPISLPTEPQIAVIMAAAMDVLARKHWQIAPAVPVCSNCRDEVDAEAWEAIGRLDGPLTEIAGAMLAQSQREKAAFRAGLEERGVKI